jgi:hypothetical protein
MPISINFTISQRGRGAEFAGGKVDNVLAQEAPEVFGRGSGIVRRNLFWLSGAMEADGISSANRRQGRRASG